MFEHAFGCVCVFLCVCVYRAETLSDLSFSLEELSSEKRRVIRGRCLIQKNGVKVFKEGALGLKHALSERPLSGDPQICHVTHSCNMSDMSHPIVRHIMPS